MWVCFIITMTLHISPPIFTVTASEPTATERECQQIAHRDIPVPRGQELLIVTECIKIPSRNKA